MNHGEKNWRFTGFYGNPDASLRHSSWTLIRRLFGMYEFQDVPIIGGDFNRNLGEIRDPQLRLKFLEI